MYTLDLKEIKLDSPRKQQVYSHSHHISIVGDSTMKKGKRKSGKKQVDDSYQPGNIGSMAGTLPSVKKKKK